MGGLHRLDGRWQYGYVSVNPVLLRVAREGTPAHHVHRTQQQLGVSLCMRDASDIYCILAPSQLIQPGGVPLVCDMGLKREMKCCGWIDWNLQSGYSIDFGLKWGEV